MEEYRFWHPLTQEVAYGTLLRERRHALHSAVAEAIVATEPDRLDERAALIAAHYERARKSLEAARWHDRAGDYALRGDLSEAMQRWRAVLVHLDPAPPGDEAVRLAIRARTRLIRYGARTGVDTVEITRLYDEARTMAAGSGDAALQAMVTHAYASTRFWRGAIAEALELYLEAGQLADRSGDVGAMVAVWVAFAAVAFWGGASSGGNETIEKVNRLSSGDAQVGKSFFGFSPQSCLALARVQSFLFRGQLDEARQALEEGLAVARAGVESEWVAWLLSLSPQIARTPEEFDASLAEAREAVRLAEECGNPAGHVVALCAVGIAKVGLGQHSEAASALHEALNEGRARQAGLFEEARILVYLAQARLGLGDPDGGWATATEAVDVARRQGAGAVECLALLTRARLIRASGGPAEDVAVDLHAALALARAIGATAHEIEIESDVLHRGIE